MTLVPLDSLVRPVDGQDDLFAFRFDFVPEGKALEGGEHAPVVTEEDNGDLIIEGYAAVFDGIDRQNENFAEGAFQRGIKAFLGGQAGLCFHHKHDMLLGKVLDLQEEEGKGLKMKARVDGAVQKHPVLGTIYEQIKKGSLNALSVGGFFKRNAKKIVDMDFTEISVTPVPVHPGTRFAVVAGKALEGAEEGEKAVLAEVEIPEIPDIDGEVRADDLRSLQFLMQELDSVFARIQAGVKQRGEGSETPPKPPSYE